jgi:predicted metalloenzyme YecM
MDAHLQHLLIICCHGLHLHSKTQIGTNRYTAIPCHCQNGRPIVLVNLHTAWAIILQALRAECMLLPSEESAAAKYST